MSRKLRIAVTGGSGFIGTNLVDFYLGRGGCEIANLDIAAPPCPGHAACWKKVDITDAPLLRETLLDFAPDYLVHLAARTDLRGRTPAAYRANTDGVAALLAACRELPGLNRAIFASSKLVCRAGYSPGHDFDYCPDTLYGHSKAAGEELVLHSGLPCSWVIVRPTSIWGPWFKEPYRNFFHIVRKGLYLHPRGLCPLKTYGYVGNTVHQIDRLLRAPAQAVAGRVFYLGDEPPLEIYRWAQLISRSFGVRAPLQIPLPLLRLMARCGDLLLQAGLQRVPYSTFRLENILAGTLYNLDELREICGDHPYTLEQGVAETVAWLKGLPFSGPRYGHDQPAGHILP